MEEERTDKFINFIIGLWSLFITIGLMIIIIIFFRETYISYDSVKEEKCYEYYRDNNYILEECKCFEKKFKGEK